MKIIFEKIILLLLVTITYTTYGQKTYDNKKLYFLVDTINVPKESRIVEIKKNTVFATTYRFYCRSFPYYEMDLQFSYEDHKKVQPTPILTNKPNVDYISWGKLFNLLEDRQRYFENYYELYIIELLPNNKYKMNLVKRERYQPPTQDYIIIKPEKEN